MPIAVGYGSPHREAWPNLSIVMPRFKRGIQYSVS